MNAEPFYKLEAPGERRYQYACRDTALVSLSREICPVCGRVTASWEYSGDHCMVLEGGTGYPDRLPFTGAGGSPLILSGEAVKVFQENGITGITRLTPVRTLRERAGELVPLPEAAPEYLLAELDGTIELDLEKMCLKKKRQCASCGGFDWNHQRLHPLHVDERSWNGRDLCRVASIPGYILCTKRVVELVRKQKLRGFAFQLL